MDLELADLAKRDGHLDTRMPRMDTDGPKDGWSLQMDGRKDGQTGL